MPMEKQGTVENQLAHTIDQTEYDSRYDRTAKKLLANKQILAQIMKGCVNEYSDCTVDDIVEKYIEGTPEVGSVGVHVDDTNRPKKSTDVIKGSNNEDSTLTEGTLFYDVRFDAIAPKSADSAEQEEVIRLIINVEAQTKFKPGYPLTKRAIYYCSRMISAQHGPIFTKSEYGKIRKVYSIWICTQPSDGFENTYFDNRSQNFLFSPLAEMASEAKMRPSRSHFKEQVTCWVTEKLSDIHEYVGG